MTLPVCSIQTLHKVYTQAASQPFERVLAEISRNLNIELLLPKLFENVKPHKIAKSLSDKVRRGYVKGWQPTFAGLIRIEIRVRR